MNDNIKALRARITELEDMLANLPLSSLQRLRARIQRLEEMLAAVGAGGVGPLIPTTVQHQGESSGDNELQSENGQLSTSSSTATAVWKLVPVEPTRGMLDAAHKDLVRDAEIDMMLKGIHSAMLAAAPQPPTTEQSSAVEQPRGGQEPDWQDLYQKEKRRAEMWVAKYEHDIGKLERAVPVAGQPQIEQEPAAWRCCPPGKCSYRQLHRTDSCPRENLPAAPQLPVVEQPQGEQESVATLADAIRAEPTELIRKWRVLELIKDHTRQRPKPLTDEQRRQIWRDSPFRGSGGQIDWFIEGTRAAERTHQIGGEA